MSPEGEATKTRTESEPIQHLSTLKGDGEFVVRPGDGERQIARLTGLETATGWADNHTFSAKIDGEERKNREMLRYAVRSIDALFKAGVDTGGVGYTVVETPDGLFELLLRDADEAEEYDYEWKFDNGETLSGYVATTVLLIRPFDVSRVE